MMKRPSEAKVAMRSPSITSNFINMHHCHLHDSKFTSEQKLIKFLLEKYWLIFCLQWQTKAELTYKVYIFNLNNI